MRSSFDLIEHLDTQLFETAHVGVMVPWANIAVETELPALQLSRVVWHYARLVPATQQTALDEQFLNGLVADVPNALHQLSKLSLDIIIVACTAAGFSRGAELLRLNRNVKLTLISAFDAVVESLGALGARRIALATPYVRALTATEHVRLEEAGFDVAASVSLGAVDNFGTIEPKAISELLRGLNPHGADTVDAVVLSCTGWQTLSQISHWEGIFGCPVVSSNTAMAIASLVRYNKIHYDNHH